MGSVDGICRMGSAGWLGWGLWDGVCWMADTGSLGWDRIYRVAGMGSVE